MLFYYLFWMFMGFIIHFYITFGTNLLTGGLAHIVVLLPVSVFQSKGISNGVQTEWNLRERDFWKGYDLGDLEYKPGKVRRGQEIGGEPTPLGAPLSCGPLVTPPTDFFRLYNPLYPKTIEDEDRSGVPPPQASVATKNLSGARFGTLPEGGIPHRWPSSSSRRTPWRGGSSSPSGLRVCTCSYVFDLSLSLSRVLSMARLDVSRALLL